MTPQWGPSRRHNADHHSNNYEIITWNSICCILSMIENFIDLLLHIVKLQKWKLTLLKIYKYENLNKCWVGKVHFDKEMLRLWWLKVIFWIFDQFFSITDHYLDEFSCGVFFCFNIIFTADGNWKNRKIDSNEVEVL